MEDYQERKISGLTVRIDRRTCIASENCMGLAPDLFELDATGIVTFRADAPDIDRDQLIEACDVCPVDALVVLDEDGNQIVP